MSFVIIAKTKPTAIHEANLEEKIVTAPTIKDMSAACHTSPGLESSFEISKKINHNNKGTRFMSAHKQRWVTTCKLLSFYGADPVSAELALTIVTQLKLSGKFQIASAVYLASFWGSQCGRDDVNSKILLLDFFRLNSLPKSAHMKKFGREQIKLLKRLNFNVRKFGKTSIEILFQEGQKNFFGKKLSGNVIF